MKKYITGVVAVLIALSAVALPDLNSKKLSYFWYKRTAPNTYVADGQGTDPLTSCPNGSVICAKGFLDSHNPNSITDATMGDTPDRKKN